MGPATIPFDDQDNQLPLGDEPSPRAPLWREVAGGLLVLVAIFVALCLLLGDGAARFVGPVGEGVRSTLGFLFGRFVSFIVPLALGGIAVRLILGRTLRAPWSEMLGAALIIVAICGFMALPTADVIESRQITFQRAGAIGAFIVDWEGIGLVGAFGSVGAALALGGVLFVGLVLVTGFGLRWAGERTMTWLRDREHRRPRPEYVELPEEQEAAATREASHAVRLPFEDGPAPSKVTRRVAVPAPAREFADDQFGFDVDADAALRALEAAEMDREFELALQRELAGGDDNSNGLLPVDIPVARTPIAFTNSAQVTPSLEPLVKSSARDARERVSRMFDSSKPVAPPPVAPSKAQIHDSDTANEDADFDDLVASAAAALEAEARSPREDDPLFDERIETRPKGPLASYEEVPVVIPTQAALNAPDPRSLTLPGIQLLDDPPRVDNRMSREEMMEISQTLEKTFADFGIAAKVVDVKQGPVVTRFEMKPAPGVKVSRIASLDSDLAMALKSVSVRILAPIPGKAVVGIEVPNRNRAGVYLKELISCAEFWEHQSPLAFALGKTIEGLPYFCDLRKMPHLLIAGATGAGKSVCLNSVICSILYRMRPDQVRMIMVDPKRVELSIYDGIPHLIAPVVCEPKRAAAALAWAVELMEDRYKKLVEFNVRNIDGYNAIVEAPKNFPKAAGKHIEPMPYVVIIVDELADLMITAKAEVEESIQRLAQMARAVGIHLILATQRPSVNVITGIIKANFPSRIAFQVSQKVDSRTILDQNGAEALLGRGDMLFSPGGQPKPQRVQGCFMSDQEVERIVESWRVQSPPMYEIEEFEPVLSEKEKREMAKLMGVEDMDDLDAQGHMMGQTSRGTNKSMGKIKEGLFVPHGGGSAQAGDDEIDEALVRAAARVVLEGEKGSTSLVQRRLKVGFARAGRLMDMLEEMSIVGPYKGSKPRDILVDCDAALAQLDAHEGRDGTMRAMAAAEEDEEQVV